MKYKSNNIRQLQGIILGKPGSGKTVTARWIANQVQFRYGANASNSVYADDGDLDLLFWGLEDTMANFMFLDDLTLRKINDEALAKYFKIRHVINDMHGRDHGIIISLLGLHRFYNTPPPIRTNFDFIMFRSAPTNPYDRTFTKTYIGDNGVKYLEKLEIERIKKPELFKRTIIWLKGSGAGFIDTPQPNETCLQKITWS